MSFASQAICSRRPGWVRRHRLPVTLAFACGDVLFLFVVGLGAMFIMHWLHGTGISFFWAVATGMAVGMVFQAVASALVSPLLGSIESMIPAMTLLMVLPMIVCTVEAIGMHLGMRQMVAVTAAAALSETIVLALYSRRCQRRLTKMCQLP